MRKTLLFLVGAFLFFVCNAQNVGIGTTTPGTKLHVVNGSSGYNGGYFPGAAIEGATNTYINILTPDNNESGLLFGRTSNAAHGGIVYNNSTTLNGLQFRTSNNVTRMVIDQTGNVGIGNTTPGFPLNFAPTLGDKVSLWGNFGAHYGFGIQNALLQIHTDAVGADIAFGYGTSSSFTETARMKGNGILQFPASLSKKITLYPGGTGDAGFAVFGNELRIASDYNGADITFGYDNRTSGFTEKFRMMANGALAVNGNAGQAGQVLTSTGNNSPQWASSTNVLFNNTNSVVSQTEITLTTADGFVALPGMSFSFSLSGNAKVFISYAIPAFAIGCGFCGSSTVFLDLAINGGLNNRSEWTIANGARQPLTFSKVVSLGAGNHTIQLNAEAIGPSVRFGGCCIFDKILNVQVIPQ